MIIYFHISGCLLFLLDGQLITGQNPWSVWAVAEAMIKQMGYTPITREITAEENTISLLVTYEDKGYQQTKAKFYSMLNNTKQPLDRVLLAMHSIVASMQWNLAKSHDLIRLLVIADND